MFQLFTDLRFCIAIKLLWVILLIGLGYLDPPELFLLVMRRKM